MPSVEFFRGRPGLWLIYMLGWGYVMGILTSISPTIAARREGGQNQPGDPGIWFPRGAEERYRERGRLRLEWERAEAKRQKEEAKKQKEEAKRQKEEKKRQAAAPVDDGTHKDIINNPW